MEISKDEALKWISEQDEKVIKMIYNNYSKKVKQEPKKSNIDLSEKAIDKNSNKYKVLLKYVNGILKNIPGKVQITELTEFKDIDREEIIKEVNNKLLADMDKELFKYYSKFHCGYYRKSPNKSLNCLRGMCKEIGLLCSVTKKDMYVKIDEKNYRRTKYLYTIKSG